jgi:hypothetical protein
VLWRGKRGQPSARQEAHGWKRMAYSSAREGAAGGAAKEARPIRPRATGDPAAELEELSRAGNVRRSMQTSKRSAERDATQNTRSSDARQDATHTNGRPRRRPEEVSRAGSQKRPAPTQASKRLAKGDPAEQNRRRDAALSKRGQSCGQTSPRAALEEVSRAEQVDETNRRRDAALSERAVVRPDKSARSPRGGQPRGASRRKEAHGQRRMARKKRMAEAHGWKPMAGGAWLEAHGWKRMARRAWLEAHGGKRMAEGAWLEAHGWMAASTKPAEGRLETSPLWR